MRQAPVVEEVAADEERLEGPPAVDDHHHAEDAEQDPALAGERGQSLSYTPERLLVAAADRLVGGHAAGARLERLTMDPIALLTSAVLATMVSVLLFVLPGIALGPLVIRTASSPLSWAGRAAGVSLLAVLIECTVLATLGLLSAASVVVVTIVLSALGFLVRRPRLRLPAVRGRRRAWFAAAAIGTAIALAVIVIPSHLGVRPDLLPRSSTSWYYLHLAQATADLGAFPASIAEWGALRPFPTDYLPVTAHTAAALLLLPGDQLVRLEIYRLLIAGSRRPVRDRPVPPLGLEPVRAGRRDPPARDGPPRPEVRWLSARRPSRSCSPCSSLWVADRAFVERDRRLVGLAVVGTAVVFLSHAEVFLILAAALVGLGIGRTLVAPRAVAGRARAAAAARSGACRSGARGRDRRRWPGARCGRWLAPDR